MGKLFDFKKQEPWAKDVTLVMQLGLTMAGCIGLCFYVGLRLDRWLAAGGLLTTLFTLFGVFGGAMVVYRQIMEVIEQDRQEAEHGTDGTKGPPGGVGPPS